MESQEHLILKYLQGELSPEEHIIFGAWLNESDEHHRMVRDFKILWQVNGEIEKKIDFQKDQEWSKLEMAINQEVDDTSVVRISRKSTLLRIAAAIAFLLISSFIVYILFFRSDETIIETTSKMEQVILPDGSEVWLNERSRLTYQNDFNTLRSLTLHGEAFFDVKPDPTKPFVIDTDGARVKVLGTSFNVKAYDEEIQTEVFVVTGKVSFSERERNTLLVLLPGSSGVLHKKDHTLIIKKDETLNALAWKDKELVFRKTPLHEVMKTLQAYFKTDIQIKNKALLDCRFTSSFKDPTLQEVMETLSVALDLKLEHQSDVYVLDGEGCNAN